MSSQSREFGFSTQNSSCARHNWHSSDDSSKKPSSSTQMEEQSQNKRRHLSRTFSETPRFNDGRNTTFSLEFVRFVVRFANFGDYFEIRNFFEVISRMLLEQW